MLFQDREDDFKWVAMDVLYAKCEHQRVIILGEIVISGISLYYAWCIGGDFKFIRYSHEERGGCIGGHFELIRYATEERGGLRLDSIIAEFLDFVIENDNRFIYRS